MRVYKNARQRRQNPPFVKPREHTSRASNPGFDLLSIRDPGEIASDTSHGVKRLGNKVNNDRKECYEG
jgi:hypothetical protein